MERKEVYILERLGNIKDETGKVVDFRVDIVPIPDFDPTNPPYFIAKSDKLFGKTGRFKKEDGSVLEYKNMERRKATSKIKAIRNTYDVEYTT